GRFQFRIGKVRDALENRKIGDHAEREAREDDRLAADLVRQPAEENKEGSAERQSKRDHDLCINYRPFQGLRQKEQRLELSTVPDHCLAGSGTKQGKDRDLEVRPLSQ